MGTVLIWMPQGNEFGHCALELDDGYYISFWPQDYSLSRDNISAVPSATSTATKDIQLEGRQPDKQLRVKGELNINKIKEWWEQNKSKPWKLGDNDCAKTVAYAITAGEVWGVWGYFENVMTAGHNILTNNREIDVALNSFYLKVARNVGKSIGKSIKSKM